MSRIGHWTAMFQGREDEALKSIRSEYEQEPTPMHTNELGIAYMWTRTYKEAIAHYESARGSNAWTHDYLHSHCGIAYWILGKSEKAVNCLRDGFDVDYADAAGGMTVPLIAYAIGKLEGNAELQRLATDRLTLLCARRKAQHWPSSIAKFVLGTVDEGTLLATAAADEFAPALESWRARFYIYLSNVKGAYGPATTQAMGQLVTEALDRDETSRLDYVWTEEFYIARHIADKGIRRPRKRVS